MGWNLMAAGLEWISQSQNVLILPLPESTWDVQPMVEVVVAAVAVAVVVHIVGPRGTTTGATKEAMTEAMIVTMTAMKNEITGPTGADLHLLTTAEGTVQDPARGPTHHVTTEK